MNCLVSLNSFTNFVKNTTSASGLFVTFSDISQNVTGSAPSNLIFYGTNGNSNDCIAVSNDGKYVLMYGYQNKTSPTSTEIYYVKSSNYGVSFEIVTYATNTSSNTPKSAAMSGNGQYQYFVNSSATNQLVISSDYGVSFISSSDYSTNWSSKVSPWSVKCSDSGQYVMIGGNTVDGSTHVLLSTNYGSTFTDYGSNDSITTPLGSNVSVRLVWVSNDGNTIYFGVASKYIMKGTNMLTSPSFSKFYPSSGTLIAGTLLNIFISYDQQYFLLNIGTKLYVSINGGSTFTSLSGVSGFSCFMDTSGNTAFAVVGTVLYYNKSFKTTGNDSSKWTSVSLTGDYANVCGMANNNSAAYAIYTNQSSFSPNKLVYYYKTTS